MRHHGTQNVKHSEKLEKLEKHSRHTEHIFRIILHFLERIIAAVTILVLVVALVLEIVGMFGIDHSGCPVNLNAFADVNSYLHHILTIVVGLEFVRMLIDTTPANILEVLTLAITRHVVLTHEDPVSNLMSVACIAALFAIRRYLIRRSELKEEMVEED